MKSLYSGLVNYWPLIESSGSRLDLTGNVINLTNVNAVTSVDGFRGRASGFARASAQLLSNAFGPSTGDISFTFNAWVKIATKPAGQMHFIAKYDAAPGNYEYFLSWDNGADRFFFAVATATDVDHLASATTFGAPGTGVWYMLTGWHNAAADTVNIAVNATDPDSAATGGSLQAAGSGAFNIGGTPDLPTGYTDGVISEVGFWNRVLTGQERRWLYNQGRGRTFPFGGEIGRHLRTRRNQTLY